MPRLRPGRGDSFAARSKGSATGGRLCIVLLAISLVLFTLSCREGGSGPISAARSGFQVITTPVRYLGAVVTAPVRGLHNIYRNLTADQETLEELEARNAELERRLVELEEADLTASRLQDLLDLKGTYNLQSTGARIISQSVDTWAATITIDKGTLAGLALGMPVMDSAGVIGQIMEIGPTSSVVRLISDEGSSISAMVQQTRAQGMLTGSADGTLHLTLIRTDQQVNVGDTVVTSGLGGVFPKGLPIGRIVSVDKIEGAIYYDITVEPFSSALTFEEVLVITGVNDDQQATAEDIAEADQQEMSIPGTDEAGATDGESGDSTDGETDGESEGEADDGSDG